MSESLSKFNVHLLSCHSFYIILLHFSRFFTFLRAFHFLYISLWRYAISSLVLCNFNGDSSSPLQRRFLIASSSSAVASVLLSLSLSLSLSPSPSLSSLLGCLRFRSKGYGDLNGISSKGYGVFFYPHLQLDYV
jgi:hypothetical protein